jgi:murein DD-endopeptidase MepM/ murein hydrolase activator NlpD
VKKRVIALVATVLGSTLRKGKILFLLLLTALNGFAISDQIGDRTKIFTHQVSPDSLVLSFYNDLSIPVTARVSLSLENLEGDLTSEFTAIIPPKVAAYRLAKFRKVDTSKPYRCSYEWKVVFGDVSQVPDFDYLYHYPFLRAKSYPISQGPGGSISHKDTYAYDFVMPVGTPIIAARDGIVAAVKSDSSIGGPYSIFSDKANFISVYHLDGTMANYYHLKKSGVVVKEGQWVKKAELIGYSGNTGFSTGPHLHFEVVRPGANFENNQWIVFNWEARGEGVTSAANRKGLQAKVFKKATSSINRLELKSITRLF